LSVSGFSILAQIAADFTRHLFASRQALSAELPFAAPGRLARRLGRARHGERHHVLAQDRDRLAVLRHAGVASHHREIGFALVDRSRRLGGPQVMISTFSRMSARSRANWVASHCTTRASSLFGGPTAIFSSVGWVVK
jgi:hypothetical protein